MKELPLSSMSCTMHVGQSTGTKAVNASIIYTDTEGNAVTFPDPSVAVDCGVVTNPETCPVPVELTVEGCQDSLAADLGDVYLQSLGRIVQLDVTVKNVCPHKRVALAVILTEVDRDPHRSRSVRRRTSARTEDTHHPRPQFQWMP